jgi:hypothetical protein
MEIKGGLEQLRSKRFYLQRRERKGCMGSCSRTWELVVPWVRLKTGFYSFFFFLLPKGGDFGKRMSKEKCLSPWCEQMFLGKEKGRFSPPG